MTGSFVMRSNIWRLSATCILGSIIGTLIACTMGYPATGGDAVKIISYPVACPVKCELPYTVQVPRQGLMEGEVEPRLDCYLLNDRFRGKTYNYNIEEALQERPVCTGRNYDFGIQAPAPVTRPNSRYYMGVEVCEDRPIRRLTGLKTRVDRVLVPSCDLTCA